MGPSGPDFNHFKKYRNERYFEAVIDESNIYFYNTRFYDEINYSFFKK